MKKISFDELRTDSCLYPFVRSEMKLSNMPMYKKDQIVAVHFKQQNYETEERMTLGEMLRFTFEKALVFQ